MYHALVRASSCSHSMEERDMRTSRMKEIDETGQHCRDEIPAAPGLVSKLVNAYTFNDISGKFVQNIARSILQIFTMHLRLQTSFSPCSLQKGAIHRRNILKITRNQEPR